MASLVEVLIGTIYENRTKHVGCEVGWTSDGGCIGGCWGICSRCWRICCWMLKMARLANIRNRLAHSYLFQYNYNPGQYLTSDLPFPRCFSKSNEKQRFQGIRPNQMKSNVAKTCVPNQMKSNVSINGFQMIFLLLDFNLIQFTGFQSFALFRCFSCINSIDVH